MPYLLHDPREKLDYTFDFAAEMDAAGSPSDTISSNELTITPTSGSPETPSISQAEATADYVTAWIQDLEFGEVYEAACKATTSQGRIIRKTVTIRCEHT